jgi:hypothetical protein
MKGCKKKTAFIRNEDAQWIDENLLETGMSDSFGTVVRKAVSEYVAKQRKNRNVGFAKFMGEENFRALEVYAEKNKLDVEQLLRDTLIQKSKYLAKAWKKIAVANFFY